MTRPETTIVLASNNLGKLKEFQALLADLPVTLKRQSDFNLPSVEETGLTFVENALLKARHACAATGLAAIADDSGIEVAALQGQPGIYSARFAGENADDHANNTLLLNKLAGLPQTRRAAAYQCVLVYMRHAADPTPIICQGSWHGYITEAPQGEGGFGYDPLFFLPEQNCTSAQLDPALKNALSHRGKAMAALLEQLKQAGLFSGADR